METGAPIETGKQPLYEKVAAGVREMIERGTYRPGERIPSIRKLSRQLRVSINTVMEAYATLENAGIIEARPQSGYYVCPRPAAPTRREPEKVIEDLAPSNVTLSAVPLRIMRNTYNLSLVPLGGGMPNADLLPADKLSRMLAAESRRFRIQSVSYAPPRGTKRLRMQIARRSLTAGCRLSPDDIVVTSGCIEAIGLALQAVCRPGDTVAIGSPVYYTFLHSIRWMGLKVLEIPSTPEEGINLDVLAYAMTRTPIHACLVIPNFNNPLGALMTDERKKALVALLARHGAPLIEDDVYGDLAFDSARPTAAKAYDEEGLVLLCSSFSKTLAPGYRVGWIAPGRFRERVEELKTLFNIATASPTQLAIAEFLTNGGYDQHLRKLRRTYARQTAQVRDAVGRHFPAGTRVTHPEGGFVLWVEMPETVDSLKLYEAALEEGIGIAPGAIFSTAPERFRNCIRLNAAFWSERTEHALETVGDIAKTMA